jgi:hypothetical protein
MPIINPGQKNAVSGETISPQISPLDYPFPKGVFWDHPIPSVSDYPSSLASNLLEDVMRKGLRKMSLWWLRGDLQNLSEAFFLLVAFQRTNAK